MAPSSGPNGVLVTHDHHFANGSGSPYFMWTPLLAAELNKPPWSEQPLSITQLVELPLRFSEFSITTSHGPCEAVSLLSIDCDPQSRTFGDAMHHSSIDALFARAGGEDLEELHVRALVAFVETILADLVAFGDLDDAEEGEIEAMRSKAGIAATKVTKAEFEKFYQEYRAESIVRGEKVEKVESPYAVVPWHRDMQRCVCGSHRGEDGGALLLCGKCKNIRYCSQECQRGDWKRHKKVCRQV